MSLKTRKEKNRITDYHNGLVYWIKIKGVEWAKLNHRSGYELLLKHNLI